MVQRYDLQETPQRDGVTLIGHVQSNTGTWVKHSDHAAEVARLERLIADAHHALSEMRTEPFRSVGPVVFTLAERISHVDGMWGVAIKERDEAIAKLRAFSSAGLAGPDGGPRKVLGPDPHPLPVLGCGSLFVMGSYVWFLHEGEAREICVEDLTPTWLCGGWSFTFDDGDLMLSECYSTEAAALAAKEAK